MDDNDGGALLRKPDFIVIGAMRSGTTSLRKLLDRHPDLCMSEKKETDFFVEELQWSRGFDWYANQFRDPSKLCGEISLNYAKRDVFGGVPERIHASLPDCKLIYMVRDPVKRAISHFYFSRLTEHANTCERDLQFDGPLWRHIVETSRYHHQISAYRSLFPDDRIHIMDFDEMLVEPEKVLASLAGFLGIPDTWDQTAMDKVNTRGFLARTPNWFLVARKKRFVSDILEAVPPRLKNAVKGAMNILPERGIAPPPPGTEDRVREAVRTDAARFREFSGMNFRGWTV